MRYWRYLLCGVLAVVIGIGLAIAFSNVIVGLVAAVSTSLIGFYMIWEFDFHGDEAGHLTSEEEPGEERMAGGYAGFHDGGGGGC